jgi:hypothetical protein
MINEMQENTLQLAVNSQQRVVSTIRSAKPYDIGPVPAKMSVIYKPVIREIESEAPTTKTPDAAKQENSQPPTIPGKSVIQAPGLSIKA